MADYVDVAEFRVFIKDTSTNDQSVIESCLYSAERAVDKDCGRFFSLDATATAHKFAADDPYCCELNDGAMSWDVPSVTGLIVKTDTNGDGTYDSTWTITTDFILEPVNQARAGIRGWPYEEIRAVGSKTFPPPSRQQPYPVQVTATWGWAAVPASITHATLLMANAMYKRAEAPFGVAGFDAFGAVRVRSDPQYLSSIAPFIRTSRLVA